MSKADQIKKTVETYKDQLAALDMEYVGETVGVAQALDDVRKALDAIDEKLTTREYEKAAQLGYGDIGSAYIFLQRTLGGLQHLEGKKDNLIAEIAKASGVPVYEEVAPYVLAALETAKPKTED